MAISALYDAIFLEHTICLISPCILLADIEVGYSRQDHCEEGVWMDEQTEARDMPVESSELLGPAGTE